MDNSTFEGILPDIRRVVEERIPFNRILGVRLESMTTEQVVLRIDMRDELIGNFVRGNLHGGVISALLDAAGGLVAFMEVLKASPPASIDGSVERFARLGTIDLRIDYLRPGTGR